MNSASDLDAPFHVQFVCMMNDGIGRQRGKWTIKTLANALTDAGENTDTSTISLWRRGKNPPSEKKFRVLEKVFNKPAAAGEINSARQERLRRFRICWERENAEREMQPRKSGVPSGPLVWKQVAGGHDIAGLLNFLIDEIVAWNDDSGTHDVNATLHFGRYEDKNDRRTVTLEASEAHLEIPATSFQIARGMLIGDKNRLPHEHFERDASGARITGPKVGGFLNGDILIGVERIAAVRPSGSDEGPLTFRVVAAQTDLAVTVTLTEEGQKTGTVPDTKLAVLKRLLIDQYGVDGQGRVILAQRRYFRARAE